MNKSIFFLMSCISIFGMQPKLHSYDNEVFGPYIPYLIGFVSFATGALVTDYFRKIQYKSQLAQKEESSERLRRAHDEKLKALEEENKTLNERNRFLENYNKTLEDDKARLVPQVVPVQKATDPLKRHIELFEKGISKTLLFMYPLIAKKEETFFTTLIEKNYHDKIFELTQDSSMDFGKRIDVASDLTAAIMAACAIANSIQNKQKILDEYDKTQVHECVAQLEDIGFGVFELDKISNKGYKSFIQNLLDPNAKKTLNNFNVSGFIYNSVDTIIKSAK